MRTEVFAFSLIGIFIMIILISQFTFLGSLEKTVLMSAMLLFIAVIVDNLISQEKIR